MNNPSSKTSSASATADTSCGQEQPVHALIGEFPDVESVMSAAEQMRDGSYSYWDVHSPFPIHGINRSMGLRPTILPWIALVHGVVGALLGVLLVWWTNATQVEGVPTSLQGYPYLVSGKPIFSFAANIPIIFEMAVLFAAFGTVLGMFGLNKLPRLHNPLFKSTRFRRVTSDKFFVVIQAEDPMFNTEDTTQMLRDMGATSVEIVHDGASAADSSTAATEKDRSS